MGVKTKLSKIEGVFFSLPAPFYEVTLFLYLLRPRRTGGKNRDLIRSWQKINRDIIRNQKNRDLIRSQKIGTQFDVGNRDLFHAPY